MNYNGCPACGSKKSKATAHVSVVECAKCGALYGDCYLGDSYAIVRPFWDKGCAVEAERYFDLTCLGSEGVTRRHGWFNPATRLLTQLG